MYLSLSSLYIHLLTGDKLYCMFQSVCIGKYKVSRNIAVLITTNVEIGKTMLILDHINLCLWLPASYLLAIHLFNFFFIRNIVNRPSVPYSCVFSNSFLSIWQESNSSSSPRIFKILPHLNH